MALITRVFLVDDLDGTQDDVSTVQFALDGRNFEIDLSARNDERLREKLAKFLNAATPAKQSAARPAKRTVKAVAAPASRDQTQAIRDWARSNGYDVSSRGRISKAIQEAFNSAH